MTAEGRKWLAAQPLPGTARGQVSVAVTMIDAFDIQLAPLTTRLRDYARRQTGCKALIAAHYGIGALIAVTILAELGDARRFDNSRDAVRYVIRNTTVSFGAAPMTNEKSTVEGHCERARHRGQ
jgi:transposase